MTETVHTPELRRHRSYWRYWACSCGWYGDLVMSPDIPLLSVYMQHVPPRATANVPAGTLDVHRRMRPTGVTP